MVLVTARDEQMIEWLKVIRVTDMESIRFVLAAFADANQPVTLRRAQQWVARLAELGLVEKERLTLQDGSAIWATQRATGMRPLNLLATRMVAREANRHIFRDDRERLVTITAFDKRGTWIDTSGHFPTEWMSTPAEEVNPNEILETRIIRALSIDGQPLVPSNRLF